MVATISIAMMTFFAERRNLINCFNSLVPLHPEELCIVDTSVTDDATIQEFEDWIRVETTKRGLNLQMSYRAFDGSYRDSHNQALSMCTQDWTLLLGSDEMITLEIARDLRAYLDGLPSHTLVVRTAMLSLVDDHHCYAHNFWTSKRRGTGAHGRIYRTGVGSYQGPIRHETYTYPGRLTIPWNSLLHPKVDWRPYYFLHLWFYKDFIFCRELGHRTMIHDLPVGPSPEELWPLAHKICAKNARWIIVDLPPDTATWVPIVWQLNPSMWIIKPEGDHYVYRHRFGQGGR